MVADVFDRRVTKLEGDMVDLGKCVVRLETLQEGAAEDYKDLSKKQDEMLEGIAAVYKTVNSKIKEPVTFKWILEKIALPILLGGGSVLVAAYAILKTLGG